MTPAERERLAAIALTKAGHFSPATLAELRRRAGSAADVADNCRDIRSIMPDASDKLVEALSDMSEPLARAESELEYDQANGIEALAMCDSGYPERLKSCDDAPIVLFRKGNANLNSRRIVSIVGTRRCTAYGQDIVRSFMRGIAAACPDALVVSGLAYGVDINAHREALANNLGTVAVLAHGLDYLYPPRHKATADAMLSHGGLVTEFTTGTNADKVNFVRRNRIVAGMADACIVVESAESGGSLITARIARDYNRDVFAFPGPVDAPCSRGCNNLIRDNAAALVSSADDFVSAMRWDNDAKLVKARREGIETQLFPSLSSEEQRVAKALSARNDLQVNIIAAQTGIDIARLTALLFSLEMKGVVRMMAGGTYHLMKNG